MGIKWKSLVLMGIGGAWVSGSARAQIVTDVTRDSLIGTWSYSFERMTEGEPLATQLFLQLNADGTWHTQKQVYKWVAGELKPLSEQPETARPTAFADRLPDTLPDTGGRWDLVKSRYGDYPSKAVRLMDRGLADTVVVAFRGQQLLFDVRSFGSMEVLVSQITECQRGQFRVLERTDPSKPSPPRALPPPTILIDGLVGTWVSKREGESGALVDTLVLRADSTYARTTIINEKGHRSESSGKWRLGPGDVLRLGRYGFNGMNVIPGTGKITLQGRQLSSEGFKVQLSDNGDKRTCTKMVVTYNRVAP